MRKSEGAGFEVGGAERGEGQIPGDLLPSLKDLRPRDSPTEGQEPLSTPDLTASDCFGRYNSHLKGCFVHSCGLHDTQ